MADPTTAPDGVALATTLDVTICEHGYLHIWLFDPQGECFAAAIMSFANGLTFNTNVAQKLQKFGDPMDAAKGMKN